MTAVPLLDGGLSVSRETIERFEVYAALLQKWNPKINLVARSTLDDIWQRHFADSLQLWLLRPDECLRWLDLGAGAGFPGLAIAIAATELDPALRVILVESDQRKAAFLAAVLRETGVTADLLVQRIEDIPPQDVDVVSARALAPLPRLLAMAAPHVRAGGLCLFPKGAMVAEEIAEALAIWHFSVQKVPSRTDPRGLILKVGDLSHA